jgi:hypothetical protein
MRLHATILLVALLFPKGAAHAHSLEVFGYAGYLGEWELTATASEHAGDRGKEFSGPLTMRHVGLCTQDGPEEKTGEIRIHLSPPASSRLNATLSVAGVVCSYNGKLSNFYSGMMICPDREAVPLKLWVKVPHAP